MRNARQLVKVAMLSAGALLAVGLAVAVLLFTLEVLSPTELWRPSGAFQAGLYASLLIGGGPTLLLGAPGYWLLWRSGHAHWLTVLPMGGVLGALVVVFEPELVVWGISCGTLVAGLAHISARRWLSPPN